MCCFFVYIISPNNFKWIFLNGGGGTPRYTIYAYDSNDYEPVSVGFTEIPTGTDANGNTFVYTLAGWYTESGTLVRELDGSLKNGQVLYARWKDPSGQIVVIPEGEPVDNITVEVTTDDVNIRSGPGTHYSKLGTVSTGQELVVSEVVKTSSYEWGKTQLGWIALSYTNYAEVILSMQTYPKYGTVTGSGVNYRTQPVVSSSTWAGQKNKGDRVVIVEEYYDGDMWWGKMDCGYWICLDYVAYDQKYLVQFLNWDGTVLSSNQYFYGETVTVPADPVREATQEYYYAFSGWDKTVTACDGNKVYTATYSATRKYISGDVDADGTVTMKDATLLWRYVADWDGIVINELAADVDRDGKITLKDATILRRYVAEWDGIELK